jgi:hypothetical protein
MNYLNLFFLVLFLLGAYLFTDFVRYPNDRLRYNDNHARTMEEWRAYGSPLNHSELFAYQCYDTD